MKKMLTLLLILFFFFSNTSAYAQQSVKSAPFNTKVGEPTEPAPGSSGPTNPGTRPVAPAPQGDLRQEIINKFGITMNGFGQQHLQWTWEKLWDVSNTKFPELVRGTTVTFVPGGGRQTGCKTIQVGQFTPRELFEVVFIHEMGHIIRNCASRQDANWDGHLRSYASEKGLTGYSRTGCTYEKPGAWEFESEDYAEMIAYYLNPNATQQTAKCAGSGPNPYSGGGYPAHFEVAKQVLGVY